MIRDNKLFLVCIMYYSPVFYMYIEKCKPKGSIELVLHEHYDSEINFMAVLSYFN